MDSGDEKGRKRRRSPQETSADSILPDEGDGEIGGKQLEDKHHLTKWGEGASESEKKEEGDGDEEEDEEEDGTEEEEDGDEEEDEEEEEVGGEEERVYLMWQPEGMGPFAPDSIDTVAEEANESRRLGPLLHTYRDDGTWTETGTVMEVYSVKISGGAGKFLFGKIVCEDCKGVMFLYNRDPDHCESLGEEAVVTLTGPYRAMYLDTTYGFYLDLFIKDTEYSEWKQVSRGMILWWYLRPLIPGVYTDVVKGPYGSAEVTYSIIENGVEAVVGVRIIGRSVSYLHANVMAYNEKFKDRRIALYNGELGDLPKDGAGELIPLSRSVLATPVDHKLIIEVSLGDDSTYTCEFAPQFCSYLEKQIKTKYGDLEIKVEWSSLPEIFRE